MAVAAAAAAAAAAHRCVGGGRGARRARRAAAPLLALPSLLPLLLVVSACLLAAAARRGAPGGGGADRRLFVAPAADQLRGGRRRGPARAAAAAAAAATAEAAVVGAEAEVEEARGGGGGEPAAAEPRAKVFVCTASSCRGDGAEGCLEMLRELAPEGVEIGETGCLGPCGSGPNVLAAPLPAGGGAQGGKTTEARRVVSATLGAIDQPAGVCFTGMKSPEDASLLEPWGFSGAEQGPLGSLKLLVRSSQLDQVPWPILLYVGFNVLRIVGSLLFHVDLLTVLKDATGALREAPPAPPAA